MYCTRCGKLTQIGDNFCSGCGVQLRRETPGAPKRLERDMLNKKIAGVCSGLANYFNVDVTLIRVLLITFTIFWGVGLIAYLVAWIAMPKAQPPIYYMPPAQVAPQQS